MDYIDRMSQAQLRVVELDWTYFNAKVFFGCTVAQSIVKELKEPSTVTVLLNKYESTEFGYIGSIEKVPGAKFSIAAFKGIRYAQAPVGELRYKPPVAYTENKVQNATHFAPPCLQWDLFRNLNTTGVEDCLKLNIFKVHDLFATRRRDSNLLPVMVFFGGVGFVSAQADTYNPEYLVQKGVIVVTVQYRLGPLGFLSTGDKRQPGNMGMLDQVEALKWVQKHIKDFGGSPDKVTLFGESAGAVATTLHLFSTLTKGLFRAAVIQSGTAIAPYAISRSPIQHVQRLAANLGCLSGSTETLLDCIKNADPNEVVAKDASSSGNNSDRKSSRSHKKPPNPGPVVQTEEVEGWPTYLSEDPVVSLHEGHFHQVPIVIGVNRDESASAVISNLLPRLMNATETDPTYPERVFLRKVVRASGVTNNTEVAKTAIKFEYFKNYNLSDVLELKDELISLHSDFSIVSPVYKTAIHLARKTRVYFYSFEYEGDLSFSEILLQAPDREPRQRRQVLNSTKPTDPNIHKTNIPVTNGKDSSILSTPSSKKSISQDTYSSVSATTGSAPIPEKITVTDETVIRKGDNTDNELATPDNRYVIHGEELLYLFRFRNPATGTIVELEDEEGKQVRDIMITLWTNMAKLGSPTSEEGNASNIVHWKPFVEHAPYTYKITDKTTLLAAYRHRKMLFWSYYMPLLQGLEVCS